jgi:hypothetical protein
MISIKSNSPIVFISLSDKNNKALRIKNITVNVLLRHMLWIAFINDV